ncbi:MAG: metal ABC transporter ATP-binding protein [Chloroflexota bacterium]
MPIKKLHIKNLYVSFGEAPVVEDVSFSAQEGECVSVLGPNGSGKTTLLKTLLGIYEPSSGSVEFEGFDRSEIGYVPQIKTLDRTFPARALDIIAGGIRRSWPARIGKNERSEIIKLLDTFGSADLAERQLPELSGGELQRIYLARGLARKPKLLILDEPATGVDLVCETAIDAALRSFAERRGGIIIMVTHDITSAWEHSQKILLVNRRSIFFGDKDKAFTDENLRATYSNLTHSHKVHIGLRGDA